MSVRLIFRHFNRCSPLALAAVVFVFGGSALADGVIITDAVGTISFSVVPTVTEFPVPTNDLLGIVTGQDGALWFTEGVLGKIGRIDPRTHVISAFPTPSAGLGQPRTIVAGGDDALWFTEPGSDNIGRIDSSTHVVNEFRVPTATSHPDGIALGPDGALWFTEGSGNNIGRIDPTSHVFTEFPIPTTNSISLSIVAGADGALWFAEESGNNIGRIDPLTHVIAEFPIPTANSHPQGITSGSDGALWFTEGGSSNKIGRIDPNSHAFAEFVIPTASSGPAGIAAGPDGAVWFVEFGANQIGRVAPVDHAIAEFAIPTQASFPEAITAGPDGALWFTEFSGTGIGTITVPTNVLTISPSGTGAGIVTSAPAGIACDNGSNFCSASFDTGVAITVSAGAAAGSTFVGWSGGVCAGNQPCSFLLNADTTIGAEFVTDTNSDVTLFASVLPASRSVQVGHTATAFATIINASGDTDGSFCAIQPATNVPVTFAFQTTDPQTNALTGASNTPVPIPAGKSQSFLVALSPTAAFAPTDVAFAFACTNAAAAPTFVGLNTLLMSGSVGPVPDIVALAATPTKDGIVDVAGVSGTGDFVVATVNVGAASGVITATADTGAAMLPLLLTICETDPASGACLSPAGASATVTINPNDTPTFAIFVQGTGSATPFSPAADRIFVRFKDASGTERGATSVAVRTQ